MVVACQFAGLVAMEPLRRRRGALVWRNDQVFLLPVLRPNLICPREG